MDHDTPPRAAWYPMLSSEHLPAGTVDMGLLFGQELAVWRATGGAVHAWENRCPHRSVRLSLGLVLGDRLACRYHGWRFGGDGRCTEIPANPGLAPPPAACARTFGAREQQGIVWASLEARADDPPALPPGWAYARAFVLPCGASALRRAARAQGFEGEPAVLRHPGFADAGPVALLLQPETAERTTVHLVSPAATRLRAAAALKPALAAWAHAARLPSQEPHHA